MKATSSSQNSNFFEELNNNTNSNINNLKDNINDIPKQKGGFGGFGFIKRGDKNPSKDEISLQSTITHPNPNEANNTTKIIEKPKKKRVNLLEQYKFKMQEYHGKMFNYNEDFKYFIRKLAQVRKEIKDLEEEIKNKKE